MTELARLASPEQLLIRWDVEANNTDAQRFYHRLGAQFRPEVIAGWPPDAYSAAVAELPVGLAHLLGPVCSVGVRPAVHRVVVEP